MDDFKSGVPRMAYRGIVSFMHQGVRVYLAYRGIVSFMHQGVRVYLAPNVNWSGYDPKWA